MPHSRKELQEVSSRVYPDLERVPGKQNWVDKTGGLPSYIERIAKHLHYEKGRPISTAIATAVATTKRWCSTGKNWNGGDLKPTTRAKACKAVASWETKKAKSKAKTAAKKLKESAEMMEARELIEAKGALPCDDMVAKEIASLVKKRLTVAEGMLPALTEPKTVGKASLVKAANDLLESELSDPVQLAMIGGPAADPRDMRRVAGKLQREVSELKALAESLDGDKNPPWEQKNPKGKKGKKLTPEQKAEAKRRAKKAGRKYPNLIDNMAAAKEMAEGAQEWMKMGDSGEKVKEVQRQVQGMGRWVGDAGADGEYGPNTMDGVKAVQRREGLKADGMVGPKTKAMLDSEVPPSEMPEEKPAMEAKPEGSKTVEVPSWESAGTRLRKPKKMMEAGMEAAPETDKGAIASWLDKIAAAAMSNDAAALAAMFEGKGWPSEWDADVDEMLYEGEDDKLEAMREVVSAIRNAGDAPLDEAFFSKVLAGDSEMEDGEDSEMMEADVAGSSTAEAATDGNAVAMPDGPPNLRESRGGDMNCGTCESYEGGKCVAHSASVSPTQVCDDWKSEMADISEGKGMKVEVEVSIEKYKGDKDEDYEEKEYEGKEDCGCDKGDSAYCPNCGMTHGESKCGCGYEWEGDEKYCPECGSANKPIIAVLSEPVSMVQEAKLTADERKELPESDFALPGRKYPIHTEAHARAALSRAEQFATPEQRKTIKAKIKARYPDMELQEAAIDNRLRGAAMSGLRRLRGDNRSILRKIYRMPDGTFAPKGMGRVLYANEEVSLGGVKGKVTPDGSAVKLANGRQVKLNSAAQGSVLRDEAIAKGYDAEGIPVDAEDYPPVEPVKIPGMPSPPVGKDTPEKALVDEYTDLHKRWQANFVKEGPTALSLKERERHLELEGQVEALRKEYTDLHTRWQQNFVKEGPTALNTEERERHLELERLFSSADPAIKKPKGMASPPVGKGKDYTPEQIAYGKAQAEREWKLKNAGLFGPELVGVTADEETAREWLDNNPDKVPGGSVPKMASPSVAPYFEWDEVGEADPNLVPKEFPEFDQDGIKTPGVTSLADLPTGAYATDAEGRRYRKMGAGSVQGSAVLEGPDGSLWQQDIGTIMKRSVAPGDFDSNRGALNNAAMRFGEMEGEGETLDRNRVMDARAFLDTVDIPDEFSNKADLDRRVQAVKDEIDLSGGPLGNDLSPDEARDIEGQIQGIIKDYTDELERNPRFISDAEMADSKMASPSVKGWTPDEVWGMGDEPTEYLGKPIPNTPDGEQIRAALKIGAFKQRAKSLGVPEADIEKFVATRQSPTLKKAQGTMASPPRYSAGDKVLLPSGKVGTVKSVAVFTSQSDFKSPGTEAGDGSSKPGATVNKYEVELPDGTVETANEALLTPGPTGQPSADNKEWASTLAGGEITGWAQRLEQGDLDTVIQAAKDEINDASEYYLERDEIDEMPTEADLKEVEDEIREMADGNALLAQDIAADPEGFNSLAVTEVPLSDWPEGSGPGDRVFRLTRYERSIGQSAMASPAVGGGMRQPGFDNRVALIQGGVRFTNSGELRAEAAKAAQAYYDTGDGPKWNDLPQATRREIIQGVEERIKNEPTLWRSPSEVKPDPMAMKSPPAAKRDPILLADGTEMFLFPRWQSGNERRHGYWGDLMQSESWSGGPPQTPDEAVILIKDLLESGAESLRDQFERDGEWQGGPDVGVRYDALFDFGFFDPWSDDEGETLRDDAPEGIKRLHGEGPVGAGNYYLLPEEVDSIVEDDLDDLYNAIENPDDLRLGIAKREIEEQLAQREATLEKYDLTDKELVEARKAIGKVPTSWNPKPGQITWWEQQKVLKNLGGGWDGIRYPRGDYAVESSGRIAADALTESNPELAAKFARIGGDYEAAQATLYAQITANQDMKVTGGMASPSVGNSALLSDVTPESYRAAEAGGDPIEIENNIDKIARNIAAEYREMEAGGDPIEIENNIDKILRNRGFASPSVLGRLPKSAAPRTPYNPSPKPALSNSPTRESDGSLPDVSALSAESLARLFYRQRMWNARGMETGADDPDAYIHLDNEIRRRMSDLDAFDPMQVRDVDLYPERTMASPPVKEGDSVRIAASWNPVTGMEFGGDAIVVTPVNGAGRVTVQRVSDGKLVQISPGNLLAGGSEGPEPLTTADIQGLIDDPDPDFGLDVDSVEGAKSLEVRYNGQRFQVSSDDPNAVANAAERLSGGYAMDLALGDSAEVPTFEDEVSIRELPARGMQSPARFAKTAQRVAAGETISMEHGTVIQLDADGVPTISHGYTTAPVASPELAPDQQARVTTWAASALDSASFAPADVFAAGETEEAFARFADGDATDLIQITQLEPELLRGGMASPKVAPNPTPLPDSYSPNDEAVEMQDMPMGTMFADVGGYTYVLHKVAGGKGEWYIAKPVDADGNIITEDPHPNAAENKKGHGPTRRIMFWRYAPKSIGGIHPDYADEDVDAPSAPDTADAPAPTAAEVATAQTGAVLDGVAAYNAGSPARSAKGNIRNVKRMKNDKFLGLYEEMQAWATIDPKGFEKVNEEYGRRVGLPATDDKHIPEAVPSVAAGNTPVEAVVPPTPIPDPEPEPEVEAAPADITPTAIDPLVSPVRSGKGNVRNVKAMSDEKLVGVLGDMLEDAGDGKPWALHDIEGYAKLSSEANKRGIPTPNKEALDEMTQAGALGVPDAAKPAPAAAVTPEALDGNDGLYDAIKANVEDVAPEPEQQKTQYISVTDTAKLIRKDLKENFPGIKFSVRSSKYAGGASINIRYEDGPTSKEVESIVKKYQGSSFDPMIDLKSSVIGELDGKPTHFGSDYVFVNRKLSDEWAEELRAEIQDITGETLTLSTRDENGKWVEGSTHTNIAIDYDGEIRKMADDSEMWSADNLVHQLSVFRDHDDPFWKSEAATLSYFEALEALGMTQEEAATQNLQTVDLRRMVYEQGAGKPATTEAPATPEPTPEVPEAPEPTPAAADDDPIYNAVKAAVDGPEATPEPEAAPEEKPVEVPDGDVAGPGSNGVTDYKNGVAQLAMPGVSYPDFTWTEAQEGDSVDFPDDPGEPRRVLKSVQQAGDNVIVEFYPDTDRGDSADEPLLRAYPASATTAVYHRQGYYTDMDKGALINAETGETLGDVEVSDPKFAEIAAELAKTDGILRTDGVIQEKLAELASKGVVINTDEEDADTIATVLKATGMASPSVGSGAMEPAENFMTRQQLLNFLGLKESDLSDAELRARVTEVRAQRGI